MSPRGPELKALLLLCLLLAWTPALAGFEGHLRAVAAHPDRALGTPGEAAAAKHVSKVFKGLPESLGAATGRQDFITPVRVFESASLNVGGVELPVRPLYANALAPELRRSLEAIRRRGAAGGFRRQARGREHRAHEPGFRRGLTARRQPRRPRPGLPGPRRRGHPAPALPGQGGTHAC